MLAGRRHQADRERRRGQGRRGQGRGQGGRTHRTPHPGDQGAPVQRILPQEEGTFPPLPLEVSIFGAAQQ